MNRLLKAMKEFSKILDELEKLLIKLVSIIGWVMILIELFNN